MVQAGVYAGVTHYLKAVAALESAADGKAVVAKMKEMPTDDPLFGKGTVRADGRKVHDAYLFEVKTPAEVEISGRHLQAARHRSRRRKPSVRSRMAAARWSAADVIVITGSPARRRGDCGSHARLFDAGKPDDDVGAPCSKFSAFRRRHCSASC